VTTPARFSGYDWASVGNVNALRFHRRLDDPRQVLRAQCPALVRDAQALRQMQLKFIAEPLAPMAQV